MDESQLQKPAQQPVEPAQRPAETAVAATPAAPAAPAATAPAAEADLRASDADRDRIADILREALAEGRLDSAEHSERLDRVYAAKTLGELEPLVRDLPVGRAATAAPAPAARPYAGDGSGENPNLVGILGGAERKGRWRVGHKITAVAIMGGVEIDLSEATFTAPELVIHCTAVMGGVSIRLPENVTLRGGGVIGIMGGSDIKAYESPDPGAPVVRVDGVAFWGGVEAKAKRGKKIKDWTRK
ncbi:DUF1707 SHOCT-like domain-containing protein [Actinacidiphila bryophytorum]|uniref:DUF1707 domain-containing protein n=1 Tax=Actinacidiphila bryophytorum TaxID=1436133 RepID=A0A9W4GWX6_9ACTN|nr:DUF1707 domain-containing protein [Actinacidiphila bryophytorum]MBM9440096.1 DUF1707 and DUF2154 domain-containing protein [Actinacidiphila bryophytorum]MBN6546481.1 DUF1707 and DUF2154 domain-containing protein [Actinacidiphila bryophytorum]CAG7602806.1 conserved hypothetical protein [Actinacidiphila bryophytorum]